MRAKPSRVHLIALVVLAVVFAASFVLVARPAEADCNKPGGSCSDDKECCAPLVCRGGSCCIQKGSPCGPGGFHCCSKQCLGDNTCG